MTMVRRRSSARTVGSYRLSESFFLVISIFSIHCCFALFSQVPFRQRLYIYISPLLLWCITRKRRYTHVEGSECLVCVRTLGGRLVHPLTIGTGGRSRQKMPKDTYTARQLRLGWKAMNSKMIRKLFQRYSRVVGM